MSAILIGYRGSGKSTLGKRLADSLWLKFVDTDDLVVQAAGKTIKEIFEQQGEDKFREFETQAIRKALGLTDHVIALGGGAVTREVNRQLVKQSGMKCIFLRCEPQVLLERIQADPATAANRPNLTGFAGGIAEIKALLEQREPWYREVATGELDVTYLKPEEAAIYLTRLM